MPDAPIVFFLISSQHFIPTGGIGSFFRGVTRVGQRLGWELVCVLDKEPSTAGRALVDAYPKLMFVWPETPLSYAPTEGASRFARVEVNLAMVANFQAAFLRALESTTPDVVLINTPEAVEGPLAAPLPPHTRVVFYTHHENLFVPPERASSVFSPAYNEFLEGICARPRVLVATQSKFNVGRMGRLKFANKPVVLPMPIPDEELLTGYAGERRGVLFIGRHEPRKNPKRFAEKVAKAGLPAKVLTNKRGEAKFQKTLHEAGVAAFEIRSELTGAEKAEFVHSARLAFNPSNSESYGYSAMETLAAGVPTLCLEEYDWWRNFEDDGIHFATSLRSVEKLQELYLAEATKEPSRWVLHEQATTEAWRSFVASALPQTDEASSERGRAVSAPVRDDFRPEGLSRDELLASTGLTSLGFDYSEAVAFENTARYLPAVSSAYIDVVGDARAVFPGQIKHQDMEFTNPLSDLFFYPWCLYSAGQGASTERIAAKDNWLTTGRGKNGVVIVGDSGGYQIQQGTIAFDQGTPLRMLKWLERIATHSMTLDFPTGGIGKNTVGPHIARLKAEGVDVDGEAERHRFSPEYMACLLQTVRNNEVFLRERAPGATRLLNVIQGRNEQESAFWYDRVKTSAFEGWAFAGKHHTQLSMTLRRLIEMHRDGLLESVEWMHFLGISTLRAAFALTYIQRALRKFDLAPNVQISFDSSSPTQTAKNGLQATVGFDLDPARWTIRPERLGLGKYRNRPELKIADLARLWASKGKDRFAVSTSVGVRVPISDLVTFGGKRAMLGREQFAVVVNHNTQAQIEMFRRVYAYLDPKDSSYRPEAIKHLSLIIDGVLRPVGGTFDWNIAMERVNDAASSLDALMLEQA
jgi:glycosyltransferase involved in cell wall biosynthesis